MLINAKVRQETRLAKMLCSKMPADVQQNVPMDEMT